MINGGDCIRQLVEAGARLFVGVPDSLMKGFCSRLDTEVTLAKHVVAANEGSAVAIAAGHQVATGLPAVVYMQNSGLGNAVNPLSSLTSTRVYGIPMLLIIGWRGEPGTVDEPQHDHQGAITLDQLRLLEIPTTIVGPEDDPGVFGSAFERATSASGPVALLVRAGVFDSPPQSTYEGGLKRARAIEILIEELPPDTAYVATTGFTARELASLRERRGERDSSDFLMVGSMGHAASIALGMALAQPDRLICCLDGDGAVAMHMGAMAVVSAEKPANLIHVVLNNGVHESVGGQRSALRGVDLAHVARGVGYGDAIEVGTATELRSCLVGPPTGPLLLDVKITVGSLPDLPRSGGFRDRVSEMRGWLRRD